MREGKSNVLRFASGAASAQLITAASIPLLTYLYDPALMGLFFILDAYCDVISLGSTLAIDKAIYVNRSPRRGRAVLLTAVLSVLVFSALAGLGLVMLTASGALDPGLQGSGLALAAALLVAARGLFAVLQALALRSGRFGRVVLAENTRACLLVSGRLGFGALGFGLTGLVIAALIGAWGAVVTVGWGQLRHVLASVRSGSVAHVKTTLRTYRDYVLYEGTSQFVRQLPSRALVILVGVLYSPAAAGAYAVGLLLCYRPIEVLVRSVVEIGRSEIAADLRANQPDAARAKVRKIILRSGMIACGLSPLLAVALLFLAPHVLPGSWHGVGSLVVFSSVLSAMLLAARPLQVVFSLYQAQGNALLLDVLVSLAAFCGMTVAWLAGLSLQLACLGAGVIMALVLLPFARVALRIADARVSGESRRHSGR